MTRRTCVPSRSGSWASGRVATLWRARQAGASPAHGLIHTRYAPRARSLAFVQRLKADCSASPCLRAQPVYAQRAVDAAPATTAMMGTPAPRAGAENSPMLVADQSAAAAAAASATTASAAAAAPRRKKRQWNRRKPALSRKDAEAAGFLPAIGGGTAAPAAPA